VNDEPTDEARYRVAVTVEKPYTAVSSGVLASVTDLAAPPSLWSSGSLASRAASARTARMIDVIVRRPRSRAMPQLGVRCSKHGAHPGPRGSALAHAGAFRAPRRQLRDRREGPPRSPTVVRSRLPSRLPQALDAIRGL
jgi:hypothetical protein